jgi:hypothetical protein
MVLACPEFFKWHPFSQNVVAVPQYSIFYIRVADHPLTNFTPAFGTETPDRVLTLAATLKHSGLLENANGKISLSPPDPSIWYTITIMLEFGKIHNPPNIWSNFEERNQCGVAIRDARRVKHKFIP